MTIHLRILFLVSALLFCYYLYVQKDIAIKRMLQSTEQPTHSITENLRILPRFFGLKRIDDNNEKHVQKEDLTEEHFVQILQQRNANIRLNCEKYSKQNAKKLDLYGKNIIWMKEEKIAMCPVFKSATSSWFRNLIELSNASELKKRQARIDVKKNGIDTISKLSQKPSSLDWMRYVESLKNPDELTGFIVVRHPFERLVSTYRNKVEFDSKYIFKDFASKTVKRYRDKAIQKFGNEGFQKIMNFGTTLPQKTNKENPSVIGSNTPLPSFWEFVQALINDYEGINNDYVYMHIRPMYGHCSICHEIQLKAFRYILKSEELDKEEPAFIRHMGWENKINISEPKLNVQRPDEMTSEEITNLYFTQLSMDEVLKLYNLYEWDFLLFNYTFKFRDMVLPKIQ